MKYRLLLTAFLLSFAGSTSAAEKTDDKKQWDVNNPPGEAYQAKINVTEGTWMNVSISPDGETILFDLLGDIYSLPFEGGEATALTNSIAWEMQPQFSPNGQQVAFTSDAGGGDNIWVMDKDGANQRQITKESFRLLNSPTWSPDGNYIAARKHFTSRRSLGAGEIWLYHLAGGKGLQLNKRPNDQKDLGEPAFSADGEKVFFSRDSTPGKMFEYSKDSNQVIYEIFSIDRLSGEINKEISGFGGSVRPTPSPDGNLMAFVRRIRNQSSIFLKDLKTGEEFPVYQKLDRDMQETWAIHGVYPTLAWTPDSQNLVFWAGGKIRKLNVTTQVAEEIPFKVTASKSMRKTVKSKVNPAPDKFNTRMLRWVQVRPDGEQVVFQALGQLYTRELPNGKPKRLTKAKNELEFYPSYSSDGDYIVYTTWNDREQGAVKKVRSRGGKGTKLTKDKGKYIAPRFSPDNKQIVYQKIRGGWINSPVYDINPAVYIMDAKGNNNRLVTKNGRAPFFAKSMDRVYLTRNQDQKVALVSVDLSGQNPITHATTKFANEYALSADQNYLVFRERYQLYVTPFTQAAQAIDLSPKASNLPLLKVSTEGGQYISWSNQDNKLHWSLGSTLYSLDLPDPHNWKDKEAIQRQTTDLAFTVDTDIPRGSTLFSGAQIITMKGDEIIPEGDILITGNRIQAIGKTGSLEVPDNAKRINVRGKTIIPGLVDSHWHGSQGSNQLTPQQNWYNLATLAFGVTTIHDPSNNTQQIFSAAELSEAGKIVAPRIFSTGTILYGAEASITAEINSLTDADDHLKRLKAQGAFSVKSYNQPRRDQRQQVLEAARNNQMMVMPEGGSTFQHNLTMIVDGHTGIEHSIPVSKIYDDVKQLWSQSETAYTPTLVVAFGGIWGEHYWYQHSEVWKHPILSKLVPKSVLYPRSIRRRMAPEEDYNHIKNAAVAAQLQDLGVKVQIGAHGQREGLGAHWEMWMFAQGGMTPLEVIRTGTIDSAAYIGMEEHIGSLEVGKLADLVVLDVDPIKSIYETDKVDMVMKNGRLYDSQTMNEIGNHPKKREKMFFE